MMKLYNDEEYQKLVAAEIEEFDAGRRERGVDNAEPIGDSGATTAKPPASVPPQPAASPPRPGEERRDRRGFQPENHNPMTKYGINLFETRKRFK